MATKWEWYGEGMVKEDGKGRRVGEEKKRDGKGRRWRGGEQTQCVLTGRAQSSRMPHDVSTVGGRMNNGRTSGGWKA